MEETAKDTEQEIYNTVLQLSYGFSAGEFKFKIYPLTLGKDMLLKQHVKAVERISGIGSANLQEMALRAVRTQKNEVLRILAIYTLERKEDLLDETSITSRMVDLDSVLEEDEEAALLVICFQEQGKVVELMDATGITDMRDRLAMVNKAKQQNRNSIPFGGLTIYGRLLDVACERYGWTLDYVLWGISVTNLQMMLADQMTSVFITDEELKHIGEEDEVIDCDDPGNRNQLHDFLNS